MKKLIVTLTALAVLTMSLLTVAASDEVETNMDASTYLDLRTERLDAALASGEIEQDDYDLLLAHMTENADNGIFGQGPNGYLSHDTEECLLGEDGQLGLFRNENSGLNNGQGNGVRMQTADGSGQGLGGANKGQGAGNRNN